MKRKADYFPIRKCKVCAKEFETNRPDRACRGVRGKSRRPFKAVTCCKKCSRTYYGGSARLKK